MASEGSKHVNVGTIGHIDHGRPTRHLPVSLMRIFAEQAIMMRREREVVAEAEIEDSSGDIESNKYISRCIRRAHSQDKRKALQASAFGYKKPKR